MKKYIIISIILLICFLLTKNYINLKPEIPITSTGGGGGFSRGVISDITSEGGGRAEAFFDNNK